MSDTFVINGGKPLEGEIEVRGAKNAAGPALISCLLTQEECLVENVPFIEDIINILDVLKSMGVEVEKAGDDSVRLRAKTVNPETMDFIRASKTRISVLFFGALLSRSKKFTLPPPGGDRIGLRPISVQLNALEKLGVSIERKEDLYEVSHKKLAGKEIVLPEFSVTATETLLLAAVLAEGRTVIKGAAAEPHVQDLGEMLIAMGASIQGLGTHTISIEGVVSLHGCSHAIIPDPIEAGTFIVIGALTSKEIKVTGVDVSHLDLFLAKLEEMGVVMEKGKDYVKVFKSSELRAVNLQALPYPGFPTDVLPIVVALLTKAHGKSLIHDPLYANRFGYVDPLRKMGADIEIVDPHRAFVFGPKPLSGLTIESSDIRAGASLIVAALMAEGKTTIENIYQIDRGYERIEERLQKLGADIKRVKE